MTAPSGVGVLLDAATRLDERAAKYSGTGDSINDSYAREDRAVAALLRCVASDQWPEEKVADVHSAAVAVAEAVTGAQT